MSARPAGLRRRAGRIGSRREFCYGPLCEWAALPGDSRHSRGREGKALASPVRQSGALKQKECSHERNLLAWFLSTRLTGAGFRLKSRKGNGTIACREKVCSRTVAMKADDQDKVRMMKAGLPEPQFPVVTRGAVAKANDTPCRVGRSGMWGDPRRQPMRNRPRQGRKETNRASTRTATPQTRNFGIAWSRPLVGPVWRRSRHSTQTPGVTAGTAAYRRTAMRIRFGRSDRKRLWPGEGRGRQERPLQLIRPGSTGERFC